MDISKVKGLTSKEVSSKTALGLSNTTIDSYSPSYFRIFMRNLFTVTTIALIPLLIGLTFFEVYRDVAILVFYIVTSAMINSFEEISVKKRLDNLKSQFSATAKVIRDGKEETVNSDSIVQGDMLIAEEGDTILADGKIIQSEYLQIDESALTGESDYIAKKENDELLSGSFVVTGKCVYTAEHIGSENYLNRLGSQSTAYDEKRSSLEKNSAVLIYAFTFVGIAAGALNFIIAKNNGESSKDILLGVTTVIGNAIPQTLVLIILVSFIISVTKLARKGILIQKRGAIDELAGTDVICMDKTGTITTNEMEVRDEIFNGVNKDSIHDFFGPIHRRLYGINKTARTVLEHYDVYHSNILMGKDDTFDQIPFTSQNKFSAFEYNGKTIILGAFTKLKTYVNGNKKTKLFSWIEDQEAKGFRVIVGLVFEGRIIDQINEDTFDNQTEVYFAISLEETLNPGIEKVIRQINKQGIHIKIISGDSLDSVKRIVEQIGIDVSRSIDLSTYEGRLEDIIEDTIIFARAVPKDKNEIVKALKSKGLKVAMIGDGVNDVLGLKQADVGIAMESGAKVARDVSDIVLLGNDYKKIPEIFFEGDNIIFNLKLTAEILFSRSVLYGTIALIFTFGLKTFIPINPTSTLISSFLGTTLAGYLLTISRQKVTDQRHFLREIMLSSIPAGIIMGILTFIVYTWNKDVVSQTQLNTSIVLGILGMSLVYTIFVLWVSGKLPKNIFVILGVWVIGMFIGTMQTIIPLHSIEDTQDKYFLLLLVIVGAVMLHYILKLIETFNPSKSMKKASVLIPLLIVPAAYFFPGQYYYAVEPIPMEHYYPILVVSAIFAISIFFVHVLIIEPILKYGAPSKSKYELKT